MKRLVVILPALLLAIGIGAGSLYFKKAEPEAAREEKKEKIELPAGSQTYAIQARFNSPEIYEATIDPVDVKPGDTQIMVVKIKDEDAPIKNVLAKVETDTGVKTFVLERTSGSLEDGTWRGEWVVRDTHDKTYHTTFVAENEIGETSQVTLTWTDPCYPPAGGNWIIYGSCNTGVNAIVGADNGNISFNGSYTMQVEAGSKLVRNSGFSLTVGPGTLVVNNTAQILETNLWMYDGDSDNYPNSTTQYAQDTSPGAGYRRRYLMSTISSTDCNDSNSSIAESVYAYWDLDGDGYYGGSQESRCSGASYSYTAGSDCNDSDFTKWQNLTGYTDADGDGVAGGGSAQVCSGASLPSGYAASAGSDCNDSDNTKWRYLTGYTDGDGDGQAGTSGSSVCSGASLPSGYAAGPGTDCNDANASIYQKTGYLDYDGDGQVAGASATRCTASAVYANAGADCDDANNSMLTRYNKFFDYDGDGQIASYRADRCTSQVGQETGGNDCNDGDLNIKTRLAYWDLDQDGIKSTVQTTACMDVANAWQATPGTDCGDATTAVPTSAWQSGNAFLHNNGSLSWDYNCDGSVTKEFNVNNVTTLGSSGCFTSKPGGVAGWVGSVPGCGDVCPTIRQCSYYKQTASCSGIENWMGWDQNTVCSDYAYTPESWRVSNDNPASAGWCSGPGGKLSCR